ncbi:rap1 GTPase-GDP dissociation stimulator 1-like isoform X1 [Mizuhopecten yessoensis]|uniref:rap1 GTPase-GDP dissociation stimulator 1-like isoform X1 n=1 Tax=Mizuhopecten yessoensis TaxID=6573 RepID=UPI000B45B746|nr:rap1 GTPase-GDP dissociation stimulator 1-like isoform X1 [Mizuhopecten yessoensis]
MAEPEGYSEALALLENLQMSTTHEDLLPSLDAVLSFLQKFSGEDLDSHTHGFVECGVLTELYKNLTQGTTDLQLKVIMVLAELAKSEPVRKECVDKGFVPVLLNMLKSTEDITMATQICRALGNICYEHDEGREAIDQENGLPVLLDLMRSYLKNEDPAASRLRLTACGYLLNVTNTNDKMLEKALTEGALDLLEQYVWQHRGDKEMCNMALLAIGSFVDTDLCQHKLQSSTLCSTIVSLLDTKLSDCYENMILELFISLSEIDDLKDILADTNLSSHLIRIIQSNTGRLDDGSQQTVKMASDLLVLLLTGDKSMEVMFSKGEGLVFVETVKWLESDSPHLQLSAALAIGNFARRDEHCQKLAEQGIVEKLLSVITAQSTPEGDITLQHAVLSALRNLAIPVSNKSILLKAKVIEVVLSLMWSETMAVVFKLLGVLRMLIDNQEAAAVQLGKNREFVTRLVEWCDVDEHAGVKGEATRLLASLIKNSHSSEVMRNAVKADGIEHLVSMTVSEHVVMQNEALVALTLIVSAVLEDVAMALKQSDLTESITTILQKEDAIPEIICNTLKLTKIICTAATPSTNQMIPCSILACAGLLSDMQSTLKEDIATSGIAGLTEKLTNHEDEKVKEAASSLLTAIQILTTER